MAGPITSLTAKFCSHNLHNLIRTNIKSKGTAWAKIPLLNKKGILTNGDVPHQI